MQLNLDQLRRITTGAARLTQEADGFHFYRFTKEQEYLFQTRVTRSEEFYMKSLATSGIQLRFRTDSRMLTLRGTVEKGSNRTFYALEVFANGQRVGTIDNFSDVELPPDYAFADLPLGKFEKAFSFEKGEKEIRIMLPWSMKTVLQTIELDDGAMLLPVKAPRTLLCFGDSITQGYDARYPSSRYAAQLATLWDADEYCKAIGGEIFFPELAAATDELEPDCITVSYGTNDWFFSTWEEAQENCRGFFANLQAAYPNVPILALTPIWRGDFKDEKPFGSFDRTEALIRQSVADLPNVTVISGFSFVPHEGHFFGDLYLHPNDEGFIHFFRNLKTQLAQSNGIV